MAAGAYRIFDYEKNRSDSVSESSPSSSSSLSSSPPFSSNTLTTTATANKSLADTLTPLESNTKFTMQLLIKCIALAALIKYGEVYFDFPFVASDLTAATVLALPLGYNILSYVYRSSKLTLTPQVN